MGNEQRRQTHKQTTTETNRRTVFMTKRLHQWQYGRFEMRGRIDTRSGIWPPFWTLGWGEWPDAGEIDVMEFYRGVLLANVAWYRIANASRCGTR